MTDPVMTPDGWAALLKKLKQIDDLHFSDLQDVDKANIAKNVEALLESINKARSKS